MNQTSFPMIGFAFIQKHAAILDTAQGTIDVPKIQITTALTNEMPITIKTEAKHTIPAQSTRIIYASIPVSNEHPKTRTIQPLPQFDECAKLNRQGQKSGKKIANTTEFPYTISADTKLAELHNLKPGETRMIRPVDITALNLLTEHDDVITYINALMQVGRPEENEENI